MLACELLIQAYENYPASAYDKRRKFCHERYQEIPVEKQSHHPQR